MRPTSIGPIFIADEVSLAVSREKDRKLRLVYDDAKLIEPSETLELRASWGRILNPLGGATYAGRGEFDAPKESLSTAVRRQFARGCVTHNGDRPHHRTATVTS